MARGKPKSRNAIVCRAGETWVDIPGLFVTYKPTLWVAKINPKLLPPSLRKEHKKDIYANGRKQGYAEIRSGVIPLRRYELPGKGVIRAIRTFLRKSLGISCSKRERGYIFVKIAGWKFIVLRNTTETGSYLCDVYEQSRDELVARFIFESDLTKVYPNIGDNDLSLTVTTIIGYVLDTLMYGVAASMLNKEVKVIF